MSLLCARAAAASRSSVLTAAQPALARSALVSRVTSSAYDELVGAGAGAEVVAVGRGWPGFGRRVGVAAGLVVAAVPVGAGVVVAVAVPAGVLLVRAGARRPSCGATGIRPVSRDARSAGAPSGSDTGLVGPVRTVAAAGSAGAPPPRPSSAQPPRASTTTARTASTH